MISKVSIPEMRRSRYSLLDITVPMLESWWLRALRPSAPQSLQHSFSYNKDRKRKREKNLVFISSPQVL